MKKIILACLILTSPVYAHAQDNAEQHMFSEGIERIVNKFFPIVCKQDTPQIIDAVKKCYKDVYSADPDLPLGACFFADGYVAMVVKANKARETYPKEVTDYINKYDERQKIFYEKLYHVHYNNIEDYNREITKYITAVFYRMSISYTVNNLSSDVDIDWIASNSTNSPEAKEVAISALQKRFPPKCKHNNFYDYAQGTHFP